MDEPAPKRRRRWYQFSLRTLMLFMVVCAVGFGWLGKKLDETRREQVVVAEIEKSGGWVRYHEMKGPPWISRHFRKVRSVGLSDTQVTDTGLAQVGELTSLKGVSLGGTQVTDAGLVHLKGLIKLEWLDLNGTQITDDGLVHLKTLSGLKALGLARTRVTDAGLLHLKELAKLGSLELGVTQVTDEGVQKLRQVLPDCKIYH